MKNTKLGLAFLMIAVSAWGQSPSLVGKPHTTKDGMPLCPPSYIYASNECPHYDPETKEWISQKEASMRQWAKDHNPKPSVKKEEFHWSCLGDCGGVPEGTKWEIIPFNHDAILPQEPAKPAWVAPEYSVLDHVWQNTSDPLAQGPVIFRDCMTEGDDKPHKCTTEEIQQWGDWPPDQHVSKPGDAAVQDCDDPAGEGFNCPRKPDKAAVPVEHKCDQCDFGVEPFRTQIVNWPNGAFVTETEKQIMALLPTDEYSHLEQLRASVVEEEKRLAKKYGASVPDCSRFFGSRMYFNTPHGVSTSFTCMGPGTGDMRWPTFAIDDYQFHGQFLLIQKGKDPNVISLDDGETK